MSNPNIAFEVKQLGEKVVFSLAEIEQKVKIDAVTDAAGAISFAQAILEAAKCAIVHKSHSKIEIPKIGIPPNRDFFKKGG